MKQRRVGLCGAGMIAAAHALAADRAGWKVVAVASRTAERARAAAKQVGARAVGYGELPAGADMVIVATPPSRHAPDALSLLPTGVGVLVEKPFALTLAEADELVSAAADAGQRLAYGENLAHSPVVVAMLRQARRLQGATHLDVRALQEVPTWGDFTTDEWGGGALFDLGPHPLAVAVLLGRAVGAGEVVGVTAHVRGGATHATDEHAEVHLRFAHGLTGRVVASWQHDGAPVWDAQVASPDAVVRGEILPRAELVVNGDDMDVVSQRSGSDAHLNALDSLGFVDQVRAFADDLVERRRPFMDAEFGRLILEIICAAYASDRDGNVEVAVPFVGSRDVSPLQIWRGHR
jgi:predicted dehydrogenase